MNTNPIYCAFDTPDLDKAVALASTLKGTIGGIKLGLEFFMANGPEGVRAVAKAGALPIFLDVKLHDIPNTVAGAVRSLSKLDLEILNVHCSGGPAMMEAAAKAAREAGEARPKLIGVTVLTSLDDDDLTKVGVADDAGAQAERLALLAKSCGLDGVVCSPKEVARLRKACGDEFLLVVPGIRPKGSDVGDQKRVLGPADALFAGADVLVIGRPITQSSNAADAARAIYDEIAAA